MNIEDTIFPVLPLRDIVVFPSMIAPLLVGREKSIHALEKVMKEDKHILLVTQKDPLQDDPLPDDLYDVGTLGSLFQMLKLPDGTVKVLVEGIKRAEVLEFLDSAKCLQARTRILYEHPVESGQELKGLIRVILSKFEQYLKLNKRSTTEILKSIQHIEDDPHRFVDTVAFHLTLKISEKQKILSTLSVRKRLEKVNDYIDEEIGILQVEKKIRGRVKRQMEKAQREYYLNEQLKAIQKELNDNEETHDEISELEEKIKRTKFSKEAYDKAKAELKKLRLMSTLSAEATVVRNYLDWLLSIPWKTKSKINYDIKHVARILDEDHYGLERVKERILEYIAVQQRVKKLSGQILCFVGPPGVGKTSLGKSIARATGRNFVRISLGGVRDEAEIRGHRRTYIGSMPGQIIQGMKKAKFCNPLFLLDEIDKLGADWRGDPSSALLEVLDPEQNVAFNDHYLDVDYDLSEVMFICTANTLRIPPALLDRMEVLRIAGYTEEEKIHIFRQHLLQKQIVAHGLLKNEFHISPAAIKDLIRYYTREAGVRNLERELANLARKSVREIVEKKVQKTNIKRSNLHNYAGVPRYHTIGMSQENMIGVTMGLAWTEAGGELLSIEAVTMPGKGRITATGQLGDTMKESVQAAESYIKSRAQQFGLNAALLEKQNIHVHVPDGATPKDGPSAGVAMMTSIISALTSIPVHRDIAMTGEVTLRGHVLPIGGVKEKILAAIRSGIKTVILPEGNRKDLGELPDTSTENIRIVTVKTVEEIFQFALTKPLTSILLTSDESEISPLTPEEKERSTRYVQYQSIS